jgi:dienelactone hydrolase
LTKTPLIPVLVCAALWGACSSQPQPAGQNSTLPVAAGAGMSSVSSPAAGSSPSIPSAAADGGTPGFGVAGQMSSVGPSVTAGGGATASAGPLAGAGGVTGSTGGSAGTSTAGGSSGSDGSAGAPMAGSATNVAGACTGLPAVTDYAAKGPFADAKMFANVGPSNGYTIYRPDASLGKDGFKHPIATWGNGIATTPDQYTKLLNLIASHGFVIIACNDTQAERACLNAGLDWLVMQNSMSGALQGKLDTTREVTIGYSWGGGAAIDTADRPNVKATFSLHGMPPRVSDAWDKMHSPLLLTTSTGDAFVTASGYVTPNYEKSKVATFYATLKEDVGHLYIVDQGAAICIGAVLGSTFGNCGDAKDEQAAAVAWLRYWACDDQNAKKFFFGDDCTLCKAPFAMPQRKNWK